VGTLPWSPYCGVDARRRNHSIPYLPAIFAELERQSKRTLWVPGGVSLLHGLVEFHCRFRHHRVADAVLVSAETPVAEKTGRKGIVRRRNCVSGSNCADARH
jgi:hypothetical protein